MLAEGPFDPGADLGFCGGAVRPINGEISADALDELTRDLRKPWVGLHVFDAVGECVVEGCLLAAEAELLAAASRVAGALGDFD